MPACGLAVPSNSVSTPAMIFSSVDFPEPLSPTSPILAPGKKHRLMFLRSVLEPSGRALVMVWKEAQIDVIEERPGAVGPRAGYGLVGCRGMTGPCTQPSPTH
jgi:hypothetical protein